VAGSIAVVTPVHHFAYGAINPIFAFVVSFLGFLLGLVFAARSREVVGGARARWLVLTAVSFGSAGIWVMHMLAMLGFDVPATTVRYDVYRVALSFVLVVAVLAAGLFLSGLGHPSIGRTLLGGMITGLGIAVMHYTGMASVHLGGVIIYDARRVGLSVLLAVVASTVLLWFSLSIRGASGTVIAAMIAAAAVCTVHYVAMSAVQVRLDEVTSPIDGLSPAFLLAPIFVVAGLVITTLAYCTVGISIRRDTIRAEAKLANRWWPHTVGRVRASVPLRQRR
jgi:NO-binding membrane sensor protein with MHYT domain